MEYCRPTLKSICVHHNKHSPFQLSTLMQTRINEIKRRPAITFPPLQYNITQTKTQTTQIKQYN